MSNSVFNGTIDELAVWQKDLTNNAVQKLFDSGPFVQPMAQPLSLIFYLKHRYGNPGPKLVQGYLFDD